MATKSFGYPGSVDAAALAVWLPMVSSGQYSVAGAGDWRVSARSGADRGITIAKGTGAGDGIMDVVDADINNLVLPAAASGGQWFMVVARRNWSTNATTFVVVAGTSEKKLPARQNNKGVLSDQPLALCRVLANSTVVSEFVDLRVWGRNGGQFALDELVKSYLTEIGTSLIIGNARHDLILVGLSPVWRKSSLGGAVSYDHGDWVNNRVSTVSTSADGNNIVVAKLTIPDPGWPYQAYVKINMEATGGTGTTRWDGRLSIGGHIVDIARGDVVRPRYEMSGFTPLPLAGAQTAQLEVIRLSGNTAFGLGNFNRMFRVTLVPAI